MTDDLFTYSARELAEDGMIRAVEHADRVEPEWSERASSLLRDYAQFNPEFMTESLRVWAHRMGLPLPPDPRAWGAVVNKAVRDGLIVRDRYEMTKIPPAHATPRPVWRSCICLRAA